MFSRAVYALKWLLMEQTCQTAAAGYLFHGLHHDLVMIHCQVSLGVDRGQLMLRRSHLVMLRFRCHAHFP